MQWVLRVQHEERYEQKGAAAERARIVKWFRAQLGEHQQTDEHRRWYRVACALADAIERGEHEGGERDG